MIHTKQICPIVARKDIEVCIQLVYIDCGENDGIFITPYEYQLVTSKKVTCKDWNVDRDVAYTPKGVEQTYMVYEALNVTNDQYVYKIVHGKAHLRIKGIIPKGSLYYKGAYPYELGAKTVILQEITKMPEDKQLHEKVRRSFEKLK